MEALGGAGARGGGQRPPWRRTAAQSEKNFTTTSQKNPGVEERNASERSAETPQEGQGQISTIIPPHPGSSW